jgi:hypothetical protein
MEDSVKPGGEGASAFEAGSALEELEKGFLNQILGGRRVARHPERGAIEAVKVAFHGRRGARGPFGQVFHGVRGIQVCPPQQSYHLKGLPSPGIL